MTPGELGCFASHYLLWEKCLELNEPIVVIEDDAQLEECFDDSMKNINELQPYGYVRLFVNGRKRPFVKIGSYKSHDVVSIYEAQAQLDLTSSLQWLQKVH